MPENPRFALLYYKNAYTFAEGWDGRAGAPVSSSAALVITIPNPFFEDQYRENIKVMLETYVQV